MVGNEIKTAEAATYLEMTITSEGVQEEKARPDTACNKLDAYDEGVRRTRKNNQ